MKNIEVFKKLFGKTQTTDIFQTEISKDYDLQARIFQNNYNVSHPGHHIWRHVLYKRTISFYCNGMILPVTIEVVRFIISGTSNTFTFYGNILIPYLRFARKFIKAALSPDSSVSLEVSEETLHRWASDHVLEYTQCMPFSNTA